MKLKMRCKPIIFITISLFFFSFGIIWANGTFTISGKVFNDKNCNGHINAGDLGIGGVTITLTPPIGPSTMTSTAPDGTYSFTGLAAGTYTVTETDPSGYCSITPNIKTVKLVKKDAKNINFADSKIEVSPPGESCCPTPPPEVE